MDLSDVDRASSSVSSSIIHRCPVAAHPFETLIDLAATAYDFDDSGWMKVHNDCYRRVELYSRMEWGDRVKLKGRQVACARFGGPLAIVDNDNCVIDIFTSSGALLRAAFPQVPLVALGWSGDDMLNCVGKDGSVSRYDVHGGMVLDKTSFGEEVIDCCIWENGVACFTATGRILVLPELKPSQAPVVAVVCERKAFRCMASADAGKVLVALKTKVQQITMSRPLVAADHVATITDIIWRFSPIQKMVISRSGDVACLLEDGHILVVAADFAQVVQKFDLPRLAFRPVDIVWCDSSLLLRSNVKLLLFGRDNHYWMNHYNGRSRM